MHNLGINIVSKIRKAEILLIGGSAGGFNLIVDLLLSLPENFPLPVVVIIHRSRKYKSSIEELLHLKSKVPVKIAEDKETIKSGVVYFAPADYHLLCEPGKMFALDVSEPVLFCRPSIDVTFQSITDVYADKVIGMLVSGANADGAEGMLQIENNQGLTVIQNPGDAEVKTMPEAALMLCKKSLELTNANLFEFISMIATLKNNRGT